MPQSFWGRPRRSAPTRASRPLLSPGEPSTRSFGRGGAAGVCLRSPTSGGLRGSQERTQSPRWGGPTWRTATWRERQPAGERQPAVQRADSRAAVAARLSEACGRGSGNPGDGPARASEVLAGELYAASRQDPWLPGKNRGFPARTVASRQEPAGTGAESAPRGARARRRLPAYSAGRRREWRPAGFAWLRLLR